MKNLILAAITASMTVGLAACGTSEPTAQPIPPDKNCTELSKPADPHGLIGREWPWPACSALSDVQPGVGQQRAAEIVYDARARVVAAKRNISVLAAVGNKETDPESLTEFHSRIENVRGQLADDLMVSRAALEGNPPQGFSLAYTRHSDEGKTCADAMDFQACASERPHSASPGLTGGGR
ncbi:hypothetical protein [Mycobacteroides abscessus]|uniref:hypothetical protein n=1 Tax=Mycobacteroides abscessus TaxID=36809 RepID=UPI002107F8C7|nr:hypothetical protein [Mycobacteroides abscessus]